jgi:DNA-binding IclR family transcriptional regulator
MTLRPGGNGWVTSTGELEAGASGVAAPVRGVPGLRASVGVVSMEPLKAADVGPQVVAAAARLTEILKTDG